MKPIVAVLSVGVLIASSPAHAERSSPVRLTATGVAPAVLRDALARELGRSVVIADAGARCEDGCVQVRRERDRVMVDVVADDGTPRRRVIRVDHDPAAALEAAVFLVGNLMRDQASDLVAELGDHADHEEDLVGPSVPAVAAPPAAPAPSAVPVLAPAVPAPPAIPAVAPAVSAPPAVPALAPAVPAPPAAPAPPAVPVLARPAGSAVPALPALPAVAPVPAIPGAPAPPLSPSIAPVPTPPAPAPPPGTPVSLVPPLPASPEASMLAASDAAFPEPETGSSGASLGIGLVPFLSVSVGRGDRATAAVDLIVGVRDRLGLGVAGIASVVNRDVAGAQAAGIAATAGSVFGGQGAGIAVSAGRVRGFQLAGVAANAAALTGFQVAGVAANADAVDGFQVAGVAVNAAAVNGFQIAGIASHAARVYGFQAAGIASVSRRAAGLQLAGVAAVAGGDVGVQVSAIANVASGTVRGAQVGLVNVAGASNGVQIGLVNVARRDAGAAFGLININPGGRTELEATIDDDALGTVVLRHGGRRFHNVYGLGGRARGDQVDGELTSDDVWLYGLGLGPTWYAGDTTIDVEAMAWHVMYGDERPWGERSPSDLNLLTQLRLAVAVPFGATSLVVGAAANGFITTDETRTTLGGARVVPGADPQAMGESGTHLTVWPSIFAGLRL